MTKQRRTILEELRKLPSHPTADELYRLVRKKLPSISLGTVYRNLEILSDCGIIKKLELAGTSKRFDAIVSNHYHVRCEECGAVADIQLEPMVAIEKAARKLSDYEIVSHRLEFTGICSQCRQNRDKGRAVETPSLR